MTAPVRWWSDLFTKRVHQELAYSWENVIASPNALSMRWRVHCGEGDGSLKSLNSQVSFIHESITELRSRAVGYRVRLQGNPEMERGTI